MRAVALVLALIAPPPVTNVSGVAKLDASVTLFWTLPSDPDVVGVTITRERLDVVEPVPRFDLSRDITFTDFSTVLDATYRYTVFSRDESGDLSIGTSVEVISAGSPTTVVSTGSGWVCWAGVTAESALWPLILSTVLLACSFRKGSR
jgi:hypothetical protein